MSRFLSNFRALFTQKIKLYATSIGVAVGVLTPLAIAGRAILGVDPFLPMGFLLAGAIGLIIGTVIAFFSSKIPQKLEQAIEERTRELIDVNEELKNKHIQIEQEVGRRRKAEDHAQETSAVFEQIFRAAPPMMVIGENGLVQNANDQMGNIIGMDSSDIIGKSYTEIKNHCSDLYGKNTCPSDAVILGVDSNFEVETAVSRDGEDRNYLIKVLPFIDHHTEQKGTLLLFVDTTKQHTMKAEHKQLQEQLLQAQKMESVGRLASGVAHDFNNLLTVIMSSCSFLTDDLRDEDPLLEDVKQIREAGNRAAALTRQLLAFSRRGVIQPQIVDLQELMTSLKKMLHRLIGENISIIFKSSPKLWKVKADPGQIEQIIVNIAINARDAMADGGKLTFEIKNLELDEKQVQLLSDLVPGKYVMIHIIDTGCGMDAETAKKVFEPFFTTKEKGKGTGLGLSVAYGIAKQHKGDIRVYSEPGSGSTFEVYIPKFEGDPSKVSSSQNPLKTDLTSGDETILVVEDDDPIRQMAVRMLKQYGYNALQAQDGDEAQMVANKYEGPIHLLLTDVVMPGLNGRETAERVLVGRPEMKLLFMSGYPDDDIAHQGVLDQEVDFIQKPFTKADLIRKVRFVLDASILE